MTEEEVKINMVVPYLERLGFQRSELKFETSFSLRIGTNTVQVDGQRPKRGAVVGRSDTLVTRNGQNLLILEIKEPGHAITDDDRNQAISYARLVHPMAPFALVSNGADTKLFEIIDRTEIQSGDFKVQGKYDFVLPDLLRSDAISAFLGYSKGNLLNFCEAQIEQQMRPLRGSPSQLTKKFIPELTVRRRDLDDMLATFEASSDAALLVQADAGVGKTSALCEYTLRRQKEGNPVLFFSGNTIEGSLLDAIAAEFNWVFSEQLSAVVLLRRICQVANGVPIIIVIDGIDEWTYPQRAQSLLGFLRGARDLSVKVVFSCRSSLWENISAPNGSDLGFAEFVHGRKPEDEIAVGCRLGPMQPREFHLAIGHYKQAFGVRASFEDAALNEARQNPFMLRVMFAVAAADGSTVLTFSSERFFAKFLELLVKKTGNAPLALDHVVQLAGLMFEKNSERVSVAEVQALLGFSANEALLPALFHQGILQDHGHGIAFSFPQLRSYLIVFKVSDWSQQQPEFFHRLSRQQVHRDALAFFLRYAKPDHVRAAVGVVWENAKAYLDEFVRSVSLFCPALERRFVPGDGDNIGFLAEYVVPKQEIGLYGFRRLGRADAEILLVPVDTYFSKSNLLRLAGGRTSFHSGSVNGFRSLDVKKEVIEHEVIRRTTEMIAKNRLPLRGSVAIAAEAAVAGVKKEPRILTAFKGSRPGEIVFPITGPKLRQSLMRDKLRCHFESLLTNEKFRAGTLNERWEGEFMSYSGPSEKERQAIEAEIDAALSTGKIPNLSARSTNAEELERELELAGALDPSTSIPNFPWPTEYGLFERLRNDRADGLRSVGDYLKSLLESFLQSFRETVDHNFGTLSPLFPLRSWMPLRVYIAVDEYGSIGGPRIDGKVMIGYNRRSSHESSEVVVCTSDELVISPDFQMIYKGVPLEHPSGWHDLAPYLYSNGDYPLTNLLFGQIAEEWPVVADEIRRRGGIGGKGPQGRRGFGGIRGL